MTEKKKKAAAAAKTSKKSVVAKKENRAKTTNVKTAEPERLLTAEGWKRKKMKEMRQNVKK